MKNKLISQEAVIRDLSHSLENLKKDAYRSIEKIWKKVGYKPEPYSSIDLIDIFVMLMFGESKYDENITKKIDFNKNKNLIKSSILSLGFDNAIVILRETIHFAEDFMTKFADKFRTLSSSNFSDPEAILTEDEVKRLDEFIFALSWMATHSNSNVISMSTLYRNVSTRPLNKVKRDSLKRYYFNHVYDLKNNVKIFDKDNMFFGETNMIMSLFDSVCDYIFGDFITAYNSLDTLIKSMLQ
jgi:hypothetical protein